MARGKTTKTCRCGRGELLTGERAKFNAKDKQGRQVCAQCVMDAILAPFTDKAR